jgi:hypothetical protein
MNRSAFPNMIMAMAIGAAMVFGSLAQADTIGINFAGGNNAGAPTPLNPGDVAGVVQQGNWNNANGTGGTLTGLTNGVGVATSASATWHADGTWGSGTGTANGNLKLFNGYLDATGTSPTTVTVSGLHASGFTGPYAVLVYLNGDGSGGGRSGNYTIGATTIFAIDNTPFKGTYVQATSGNGNNGNYIEFDGLTDDSFILSAVPVNFRSPVNAVQVAQEPVPEPATLALAGLSILGLVGYASKRRKRTA